MKAFVEIVRLELVSAVRSGTLALLLALSVGWMFFAPHIFTGDGSQAGMYEMSLRYSLGGVVTLLAIALLVSSAGSIARERATHRLQLTMVRPVGMFTIAVGKAAALSLLGAGVLAVATAIESVRQNPLRRCASVLRPILPSPTEAAKAMYDAYLADPETPAEAKKASRGAIMRMLTRRAIDQYQTVNTNGTASWRFPVADGTLADGRYAMRFRFTNLYEMRDDVRGEICAPGAGAVVSNITQAIVKIPLVTSPGVMPSGTVSFRNDGERAVMLRPRKDVALLCEADGFLANLWRAYAQLVALLALMVAFGVFLGAGLSRPVAVFVAIVTLALSEMSPSVVEQYPDDLETNRIDAIGLTLARISAAVTHPVGSLSPLSALAADERIEPCEVAKTLAIDAVALPALLLLLAAFAMPRKRE